MNNATKFEQEFGMFATELWGMTYEQFVDWLNLEYDNKRELSINAENIISIIKNYISDINLAEIAAHIEQNNLPEWIDSWRFAFETDILNSMGTYNI